MKINELSLWEYIFTLGQYDEADGAAEAEDEYIDQLDQLWWKFSQAEQNRLDEFVEHMKRKGYFQ